jgi:Tol biopolymer transport system component
MKIRKRLRLTLLLFGLIMLVLVISLITQAATNNITLVSVAADGAAGNGHSYGPGISDDGRYVAFFSGASNLVNGDTNEAWDIFVYDIQTGTPTRVSVASDGTEANGHADIAPAISADGRYVAFFSYATNLVSGDTNGRGDIFLHDLQSGATTRVSIASDGTQANDQSNEAPAISAGGRYVAFFSYATNLLSGDTNWVPDVFVHDTETGVTTRASVTSDGIEGNNTSEQPAISADGRYVAFVSLASNLASGDTNDLFDVYLHDMQDGTTSRISVASDGAGGNGGSFNPALSADGRYVAFESEASNLVSGDTNGVVDVFVHDTQTGTTTRVSLAADGTEGNGRSVAPAISANGRYVTFSSFASNLISGDTNGAADVFVYDTQTGAVTRVSLPADGTEGNGDSSDPAMSADGRHIAFSSIAFNLVVGDTNPGSDIFVVDNHSASPTVEIYLPIIVRSSP